MRADPPDNYKTKDNDNGKEELSSFEFSNTFARNTMAILLVMWNSTVRSTAKRRWS